MALPGDYKKLITKWLNKTHAIGSPELDALIDISDLSGVTRKEIAMANGEYFTSSISRTGRAIDGVPDFTLYTSQYYKDSSGNRETITGLQSAFFDKDRKSIMSPGKRYVFRTVSTGTATGTVDSLAQFSFTQKPI